MKKNLPEIKISDHALIRYIERVLEVDLTPIRNEMLQSGIREYARSLGGNGTYPAENCKMVLKNKVVATVIANKKKHRKPYKCKKVGSHSIKKYKRGNNEFI